jgi:hypothetical protein
MIAGGKEHGEYEGLKCGSRSFTSIPCESFRITFGKNFGENIKLTKIPKIAFCDKKCCQVIEVDQSDSRPAKTSFR